MEKVGSWSWPLIALAAQPPLLQAWASTAVSILGCPVAVITAGVERWVESSVFHTQLPSEPPGGPTEKHSHPERWPGQEVGQSPGLWSGSSEFQASREAEDLHPSVTLTETWEPPLPPLPPFLLPAQSSDLGVPGFESHIPHLLDP